MRSKVKDSFYQRERKRKEAKLRQEKIIKMSRQKLKEKVPIEPLTVDSDIQKYINRLNKTVIVREPKTLDDDFQRQIKSSRFRNTQVSFGGSLVRAARSPPVTMRIQGKPVLHMLTERESITPNHEYIVPQTQPTPSFILPNEVVQHSKSMRMENDLNRLKNRINEHDRLLYNEFAHKMNLIENRREGAIKERYTNFINYGMKESMRRDKRGMKIDDLRGKRPELIWWNDFLNQFSTETKGTLDLECVEKLSVCRYFDEQDIIFIYKSGVEKSEKAAEIYKKVIKQANEIGNFLSKLQLGICFKVVDDKEDLNDYQS